MASKTQHILYTTLFYTPTSHFPVCFAGTGGESIYGSKFPGKNAKLWSWAHDLQHGFGIMLSNLFSSYKLYLWFISDESPRLKHDGPGLLSMAVADRDMLGSHFTLTFKADPHLDRFAFLTLFQWHLALMSHLDDFICSLFDLIYYNK